MHGLTMGGGVGISIHGSYKIASDDLLFSMPETKIGFMPDVGTLHVLSRIEGFLGYYLGLTGNSIYAQDALEIKAVNSIVRKENLEAVLADFIQHKDIKKACKPYQTSAKAFFNTENKKLIEKHFSLPSLPQIMESLQQDTSDFAQKTYQELLQRSPTSLFVVHAALNKAEKLSFEESLQMEFDLTYQFLQKYDFYEGVRAALVDKDKSPKWQPDDYRQVTKKHLEPFFKGESYGKLLKRSHHE